ncbi:MAG: M13 family metallopeptidase [Candidatus Eiseniibacteriota bacterium]
MIRARIAAALLAFVLVSGASVSRAADPAVPSFVPGYRDTTCSPCKDFNRYATGAWMDTVNIPPSYTGIGSGREQYDRNAEVLYRVLEDSRKNAPSEKDPTLKKLGEFYASCMDSDRAEREGAKPIEGELARIDAIKDRAGLARYLAHLVPVGMTVPFEMDGEADSKNSSMNIAQLGQGGLGLPERDFYTRTDSTSVALRTEYVAHMGRMFQLIGVPADQSAKDAAAILEFETTLAKASMTRVEMRDPSAIYHKMSVAELDKTAPGFDWSGFFKGAGLATLNSPQSMLDVAQPEFMTEAAKQISSAPLELWKAYLKHQLLRQAAPHLSTPFFKEDFAFTSRLSGQRAPLPRWRRCSAEADFAMGEALGKAYVAQRFTPAAKARALDMVNNLQITLRERIGKLDWMSDSTKARAIAKLSVVLKKIGYPDTWRDYTALRVSIDSSYVVNVMHAGAFETHRKLARIDKPVDRTEWGMSPPTVNAYYNPYVNEIVFPAGIMQPPRFNPDADDAYNYGGMGMVIGHEMTHGFDDEGRQFDAVGNLRDWWTPEDAKRFKERADKIVQQYNSYVAVDTLHVNGALTLGENIADLGGATIAYYAYQRSLEGKPRQVIDGFTPEQRFFIGYGQGWRSKLRPEALRTRTLTDPHSPPQWRVNGPMSNMPEFRAAWGCKQGDGMVRADVVTIW